MSKQKKIKTTQKCPKCEQERYTRLMKELKDNRKETEHWTDRQRLEHLIDKMSS